MVRRRAFGCSVGVVVFGIDYEFAYLVDFGF